MSPKASLIVKSLITGCLAAAAALQAYLPGLSSGDIVNIVLAGVVAAGAAGGISAGTALEPNVGRKSKG